LLNEDLTIDTNPTSCGRHHGVYLIAKTMTTQPHQRIVFDDIKEAFLGEEWELFPSLMEETRLNFTSTSKISSNTIVDCT
jgi:hypothetical protein